MDSTASTAGLAGEWKEWAAGNAERIVPLRDAALTPMPSAEDIESQKAYQAALFDTGWLSRGWAVEFGGSGGDAILRAAVYDLLGQSGFPVPTTVNVVEVLAPALTKYAPHLAARYLPKLISGREAWCQGFSEPDAGSDLASLRTKAVRDGDEWVINGQKTWSTRAFGSDRCVVLVRTGTQESRHRGLSMMLVDMDAPGVSVHPIDEMSGTQHFGEIFLEDVRIGDDRVIGEIDQGWAVAQHALQWERGMFGWIRQAILFSILRRLAAEASIRRPAQFGAAYQDLAALRARSFATIEALVAGASSGPQVSIDKLLLSQAERSVQDIVVATLPVAVDDGREDWTERLHDYVHSRTATIYGGSAEIQRTIIADQVLELRGVRS